MGDLANVVIPPVGFVGTVGGVCVQEVGTWAGTSVWLHCILTVYLVWPENLLITSTSF